MWSIAKRELFFYFSNIIGYLVIGSYLTLNTLLLWFFDTPYQLLNSGFGDLSPFFEISPWIFLFLIPALSMRSFSEERANGTLEILITKPLKPLNIFGGKFLGIALIIFIILLSTSINIIALQALIEPQSKMDLGSLVSSYFGLILLCFLFLSISVCCSILFRNQVSSFLVAVLTCYTQFFVWDFIADSFTIPWLYKFISDLGIQTHYLSLIRGILRLEDMIYFLGLIIVFFTLGIELIKKEQS
jgi:ABC-2 type transport system permease protein